MAKIVLRVCCAVLFVAQATWAGIFFGPILDPNASGSGFGGTNLFGTGLYTVDDNAVEPGTTNDIVRVMSGFHSPGSHSVSMAVRISNGENGNNGEDSSNPDPVNLVPPHFGFVDIGNPTGRLENGNVVRFSFWMRESPLDPVIVAPTVEPVVKLEFWTEALSNVSDPLLHINPRSADRIYDTQLQGMDASFIDLDGDNMVNNQLGAGNGGTFDIMPGDWTLIHTQFTVNDTAWGYDYPSLFVPKSVGDVEEIRATLRWSEFLNTDLSEGGTVWIDQPMVEIYRSSADMPGMIPNPYPGSTDVDADFNDDMQIDCTDIDALVSVLASGQNNLTFDINGDGTLDLDDRDEWLAQAGAINLPSGNPYLLGDANLDGFVDISDFNRWNGNKFTSLAGWCRGDFTADGIVDISDFNVWNANKFSSSDSSQRLPEPASGGILACLALLAFALRRRR